MEYKTIISAADLVKILDKPDLAIIDCRFYLPEPERGHQEFLEGHIPGAIYLNLDRDLSGKIIPGITGRHPLPDANVFAERLSGWGIDRSTQVIAYDNMGGALAARLWWMLRWLGHDRAAVMDGGWNAWVKANHPQEVPVQTREPKIFTAEENPDYIADLALVDEIRLDPDYLLIDARAPERYWGLQETIDPIAGHIPGAITAPFLQNMTEDEYFLVPEQLLERYQNLLEGLPAENVIHYCGSGVTSIHNIIAMMMAGFDMPKLYAGSWSEWINDPDRPIAP